MLLTVLGGSIYAYVIGSACNVIAMALHLDGDDQDFKSKMDSSNRFLKQQRIPAHVRSAVRSFLVRKKGISGAKYGLGEAQGSFYADLSPKLRKMLAHALLGGKVRDLPL
jgi:hypothetical protein